mmetsp:Transcript_40659/g.82043  ORF Transcript_40659/g.82043 Transcript_40659/m.82043 type:complete len:219 (+) Transcript_40659:43-699(+)
MMRTVAVLFALAASVEAWAPLTAPFSRSISTVSRVTFEAPSVAAEGGLDDPIDDLMESSSEEAVLLDMTDLEEELEEDDFGPDFDVTQFGPSRPYVNQQAVIAAVEKYRRHASDVGSPEYQIAVAHERIKYLTAHLQTHPKDYASRRGLVAIVNKRRRLLNYLYRETPEVAMKMVSDLGVRFKPPGAVMTRADKYAVYNEMAAKTYKRKGIDPKKGKK